MSLVDGSADNVRWNQQLFGDDYSCTFDVTIHQFSTVKNQLTPIEAWASTSMIDMQDDQFRWKMMVYPNDETARASLLTADDDEHKCLGIAISLLNPYDVEVKAALKISFLNQYGEALKTMDFSQFKPSFSIAVKEGRPIRNLGFPKLVTHETIQESLLIEDSLRIQAQVRFVVKSGGAPRVHQSELVMNWLEELWNTGRMSDFKIESSDGKLFPVHRLVLCQSEYFAAMFETDLDEGKTGKCNLPENAELLSMMLRFMYGFKGWNTDLAEQLIVLANKYSLKALEKDCTNVLANRLVIYNAASLLRLADSNSLIDLKSRVVQFIAARVDEFLTYGGFKELEGEPDLVREILDMAYEQRSKKRKNSTHS